MLVNDEDLTFATVQPDPASLELLLSRGGELPTAVGRTLALTTTWGLLYDGELTAQQFVDCGVGVLIRETADSVTSLHWAYWSTRQICGRPPQHAIGCSLRSPISASPWWTASDRPLAALRGLAQSATTPTQLEALSTHATEPDLRWRRLIRLAELGQLDESDVEQLLAEDPDPDAWMNAVRVRAAVPSAEAKAQAWQAVVVDRKIPPAFSSRWGAPSGGPPRRIY